MCHCKIGRGKVVSVGAEGGLKRPVHSRRADDSGEGLLRRQKIDPEVQLEGPACDKKEKRKSWTQTDDL